MSGENDPRLGDLNETRRPKTRQPVWMTMQNGKMEADAAPEAPVGVQQAQELAVNGQCGQLWLWNCNRSNPTSVDFCTGAGVYSTGSTCCCSRGSAGWLLHSATVQAQQVHTAQKRMIAGTLREP